jgi:hypothetical protein
MAKSHLKQFRIQSLANKCSHFNITESCEYCHKSQIKWYQKIKKKGFEDIEDNNLGYLKKWTGISSIIDNQVQESWPEPNFSREEELLNHSDFKVICENLFKHQNNVITSKVMINIWGSHCKGLSLRQLENKYKIPNPTIFRAIRKLKGFMKIMDLNQNVVVVIRSFDPEEDSKLIFSSWRKSVWFDTHENNQIDFAFFRKKTKEIKNILNDSNTIVKIACDKNKPDQIVGYSVMTNNSIEFVYIKFDYRKEGIATLLTKGFKTIAKPSTKIGASIAKNHGLKERDEKEE